MENEGYETIDLLEVLNAVRQHLLAVILTTVILAGVGFGVSKFLITPQYEASALMIVNTRQDTTSNVTSDQINSANGIGPLATYDDLYTRLLPESDVLALQQGVFVADEAELQRRLEDYGL